MSALSLPGTPGELDPIVIGDATGVGYLEGAVHEGFHAGLAVG